MEELDWSCDGDIKEVFDVWPSRGYDRLKVNCKMPRSGYLLRREVLALQRRTMRLSISTHIPSKRITRWGSLGYDIIIEAFPFSFILSV